MSSSTSPIANKTCSNVIALFCSLCSFAILIERAVAQGTMIQFEDVTTKSGISFRHSDGSTGKYYMLESMSAGVALLDYDLDGLLDIYLLSGCSLEPAANQATSEGSAYANHLYRNLGNWHFEDVTAQAGVGDQGFGLGVAVADYDNDGDPDLYVSNYGYNRLYRNNGDGTFSECGSAVGTDDGYRAAGGVSFADLDRDGNLDLFVANYIQFDPRTQPLHMHKGMAAYPSPLKFEPEEDALYRNLGDGSFADISADCGVTNFAGRGMGVVIFDFDQDGDGDMFVANDSQANFLYEQVGQEGDLRFDESALLAGFAYDFRGNSQASMGIDVADIDGDGLLDVYVTSLSGEYATLYRNLGGGFFEDSTRSFGAGDGTYAHVTWGVVAEDFDHDGWVDLFLAAGHLDDRLGQRGGESRTTGFRVGNLVLRNVAGARFESLDAEQWSRGTRTVQSSRGLACGDLDGDMRLDLVVLNSREKPTLLKNSATADALLGVRLVGTQSNRDALGAQASLVGAKNPQLDIVTAGSSYQSCSAKQIWFSLPKGQETATVRVDWPIGETQEIQLQVGRLHTLVEPDQ